MARPKKSAKTKSLRQPQSARTDSELRRMDYPDLQSSFRNALKLWAKSHDRGYVGEVMNREERASVRASVHCGCRWIRALDRAVALKLPGAIAECTFTLCDLFANLKINLEAHGEINRIAPHARAAFKRADEYTTGAVASNAKRLKRSNRKMKEIIRIYDEQVASGNTLVKAIVNLIVNRDKYGKERFVKGVIAAHRKKLKQSGAGR